MNPGIAAFVLVARASALLACLGLIATGCVPADRPAGAAGEVRDPAVDTQEVLDAHGSLVEAFEKGDTNGFVLMLDKSDDLLIYHARLQDRWVGIDEVQKRLPEMFARLGKVTWLDVHLFISVESDVAWLTSQVLIESSGLEAPFTGRGTEIWVRRGGHWRLRHGHWSENPEF